MERMTLLRRNRYWLALLTVLAMVFTIGGAPAFAMACGEIHRSAKSSAPTASAPSQACHERTAAGRCCCGSRSQAAIASFTPSGHSEPGTASALSQPGCGCTIQTPSAPPASGLKAATLLLAQDLLFLPDSPVLLHLSAPAAWAYAVSANGPPRSPVRSSGPSRAPPAC